MIKKIASKITALDEFFKFNPDSLVRTEVGKYVIENPWGDNTVSFSFSKSNKKIQSILNNIILPKPFSAIYHRDSKKIEFIYSIFNSKVRAKKDGGNFSFIFEGKTYNCEFSETSKELLGLAAMFKRNNARSVTNYRNLDEFEILLLSKKLEKTGTQSEPLKLFPVSFFVDNIVWNEGNVKESEAEVIRIANHINFYVSYFDVDAPAIVIHEEAVDSRETKDKANRFLLGEFPKEIKAHKIDPYLLGLHDRAEAERNNFLKYLYYYQIIEYASFYYLKEELSQKLNMVLLSPYTENYIKTATQRIIEIMSEDKVHEIQKFNLVIKRFVEPDIVWKVFEPLKKNFTKDTTFDGNFTIKKFPEEMTADIFRVTWESLLSSNLREIRNAIAHSGENSMTSNILPTRKNSENLGPWVSLISIIAKQIMLNRNI